LCKNPVTYELQISSHTLGGGKGGKQILCKKAVTSKKIYLYNKELCTFITGGLVVLVILLIS